MRWDGVNDKEDNALGLFWVIQLRWVALALQLVVCAVCALFLKIHLPLLILGICIALTAVSNLVLWHRPGAADRHSTILVPGVVAYDILVLTIMLYYSGGAHNPFTMLYLLHITIAVILLPGWRAWAVVALCGACFGLLFTSDHTLVRQDGGTCCDDLTYHLQGMFVGMLVAGSGVAYFVNRLSSDLQRQHVALNQATRLSQRQQRFAGLATLAAGVAHELATPLGTIAVISGDLLQQACDVCHDSECRKDAHLIRQEVQRCHTILEKLSRQAHQGTELVPERLQLGSLPMLLEEYLPRSLRPRLASKIETPDTSISLPLPSLLQSLSILVKNAAEASPDSTPIRLSVVWVSGALSIAVSDHGTGMPEEVRERLGEPFFTTKQPGSGMGLGLFLVRTFLEQMGGMLRVETQSGEGSTVAMVFPAEQIAIR